MTHNENKVKNNQVKQIEPPGYAILAAMIMITAMIIFIFSGPLDTSPLQSYSAVANEESK